MISEFSTRVPVFAAPPNPRFRGLRDAAAAAAARAIGQASIAWPFSARGGGIGGGSTQSMAMHVRRRSRSQHPEVCRRLASSRSIVQPRCPRHRAFPALSPRSGVAEKGWPVAVAVAAAPS